MLELKEVVPAEAERLSSIWNFWSRENEDSEDTVETDEALHPDHLLPA